MKSLKIIFYFIFGAISSALAIVLFLICYLEEPALHTDLHWENAKINFKNRIEDTDPNEAICLSVGAHVSPERGVNKSLAKLGQLVRKIGFRSTGEWADEVDISTRGHAWLNILSGKKRILTVGLWPGGVHVNSELDENPEGWMTRCLSKGEAGKIIDAIERRSNVTWTGYYNCSNFVADVWNELFPSDRINSQPVKLHRIESLGNAPFTRLIPPPPSPWGIIQTSIGR